MSLPRLLVIADAESVGGRLPAIVAEAVHYGGRPSTAPSPSPGTAPALGPSGLAALCQPRLPVFALGGVTPDSVPECLAAGAYGAAAVGPIPRSPMIVTEYLERLPRWTHP